jgi:hypothetical protein
MNKILCGNCGGKVPLPAGHAKAKIRCVHCGYYADVPPDQRSAEPPVDDTPPDAPPTKPRKRSAPPAKSAPPVQVRERANPRDTRPEFVAQENAGPPLLEGNQDEDDAGPYTVHGSGLKNCPECRNELPLDATFCVHCGVHLDAASAGRPKKKRTYTEIDEWFGEGFRLPTRLALFAIAQVLNVLLTAGLLYLNAWKFDAMAVATGAVNMLVNVGLQAFILGSYDTLRVQRTETGKATLTRTRRLLFIPLKPAKIAWKQSAGVGRYATHAGDVFAWATCLYLLACAGCLPGILFWWFVLKPERFNVALADIYQGIEETVFHAKDGDEAEKVSALIAEATGLRKLSVL